VNDSPSIRQTSCSSSATENDASKRAIGSAVTSNATAPSPSFASSAPRGAPIRQSLATTSTARSAPEDTAWIALSSAAVPARSEPAWSWVSTSRRRSSAFAISAAPCFSRSG
jgi:hypothetical protein